MAAVGLFIAELIMGSISIHLYNIFNWLNWFNLLFAILGFILNLIGIFRREPILRVIVGILLCGSVAILSYMAIL